MDTFRAGQRRAEDRPPGPVSVPITPEELAKAGRVAARRVFEQVQNSARLASGRTGRRGNVVGRLVEVALVKHLRHVLALDGVDEPDVEDISDLQSSRFDKEGDVRVAVEAGGSPVRLDAKGIRVENWFTYGREVYRSQLRGTRVDVLVWGTVPDDPDTTTEVLLDGWLPMSAVLDGDRPEAGDLQLAGRGAPGHAAADDDPADSDGAGSGKVPVTTPMLPMADLVAWIGERRHQPPPPPTTPGIPGRLLGGPPGRRIRQVTRDGVPTWVWEDETDPAERGPTPAAGRPADA